MGAISRDCFADSAFLYGQRVGDVLSLVAGGAEFLVGDGMTGTGGVAMAVTAGGAAPVAVPLSASGAAIATHGSVVMGKALVEFSKGKETNSQLKTPKGNLSGKQASKDVPNWVKGLRPKVGESGKDFAKRLMDEKYGPKNYNTGPKTEFNKIKNGLIARLNEI